MNKEKIKRRKSLYLIVNISPAGFSHVEFRFQMKKPKPLSVTRGEGNCMVFKLSDGDYSSAFHDAIQSGDFISAYGDFTFSFDLSKIPQRKIDWEKQLQEYKNKYQ